MMERNVKMMAILVVMVLLVMGGLSWYYSTTLSERDQLVAWAYGQQGRLRVDRSPVIGPDDAAIQVVQYADFGCPVCAESYLDVVRLPEAFDGKVQVVFKYMAIEAQNQDWALAAMAAHEMGAFQAFATRLYTEQGRRPNVETIAETVGLDPGILRERMIEMRAQLDADVMLAEALSLARTPTYFINGIRFEGHSDRILRRMIQEILAQQDKRVR